MTAEEWFGQEVPKPGKDVVRAEMKRGYHYFRYIDENNTYYRSIMNCDSKMDYIPQALISFCMKHVCYQMIQMIRKHSKNFKGSMFEEAVNGKPEMYGELKKRIDDWLEKQKGKEGEEKKEEEKKEEEKKAE